MDDPILKKAREIAGRIAPEFRKSQVVIEIIARGLTEYEEYLGAKIDNVQSLLEKADAEGYWRGISKAAEIADEHNGCVDTKCLSDD